MKTFEEWLEELPFETHLTPEKAWNAATQEAIKVAQKYGALNVELELRGKTE